MENPETLEDLLDQGQNYVYQKYEILARQKIIFKLIGYQPIVIKVPNNLQNCKPRPLEIQNFENLKLSTDENLDVSQKAQNVSFDDHIFVKTSMFVAQSKLVHPPLSFEVTKIRYSIYRYRCLGYVGPSVITNKIKISLGH